MTTKSNTQLQSDIAWGNAVPKWGCLLVSVYQASTYFLDRIPDREQAVAIVFGLVFILLTSHRLTRMLIPTLRGSWAWHTYFVVAIICAGIMFIEVLSINTSTAAVDGNLLSASISEKHNSPEYKSIQKSIANKERQIEADQEQLRALQRERNSMPADWASRKADVESRIDLTKKGIRSTEYEIKRLRDSLKTAGSSITEQTFARVEARTGLSITDAAFLFALLLSACPLVICLAEGNLDSTVHVKPSAGKGLFQRMVEMAGGESGAGGRSGTLKKNQRLRSVK